MTQVNDEMVKAQLGMVLTMVIADKLDNADLLEVPESHEERIAVCQKGLAIIEAEAEEAFKPTEEAQRMKKLVVEDLIESHYEYFGLNYDEFKDEEITFKAE